MVFFRIALRNLFRNKRRTALTLCTMVFGLATLAFVKGYANAVRRVQLESTVYGTTGMIQIYAKGFRKNVLANPVRINFADSKELRAKVMSVPGVKALAGRLVVSALFSLPQSAAKTTDADPPSTPLTLIAIEPANEKAVSPELFKWVDQGKMIDEAFPPGIVLGRDLAHALLGDEISLAQAQPGNSLGSQSQAEEPPDGAAHPEWPALLANDLDGNLNGVPVSLTGTLSAVLPGDKRFGYMNLTKAQELLRLDNKLTAFVVSLEDLEQASAIKQALESRLGPEFEVFTWDELAPYVKDILQNIDLIFVMVTVIFILVIGMGVANALLMTVMERKTEIGTILAVGGKRAQIAAFFTIEGFFLGIFGGVFGTLFGLTVVAIGHKVGIRLSAPGSDVKIILRTFVTIHYVLSSFGLTVILSALVSLWPALRASALKPVEALQNS